jgi:segregation and condensation protein A
VRTPAFEGPIELLVSLAQRTEVDLATIPLAALTDDYLRALEAAPPPLDQMAAFLVIGARLVQLKAAALLPGPAAEAEEDLEAWESAIRGRLEEYKRFKMLAESIMRRHSSGHFTFAGLFEPEVIREPIVQVSLDALASAFQQVLDRLPPPQAITMEMEHVSLSEKLEQLRTMMRTHREMNFTAVFAQARTRLEAVVIFLALLELIRIGEISVVQSAPFAEIRVRAKQP